MKNLIRTLFLFVIITFTAFSCDKDETDNNIFHVKDFSYDGCKNTSNKSSTDEYIEYKTIDDNYLSIKHVNVFFSCCPKANIIVNSEIRNDTIIIYESEENISPDCDCICYYDINLEIGPLEYGEYNFIIKIFDYTCTEFLLDFSSTTNTTHYIDKK